MSKESIVTPKFTVAFPKVFEPAETPSGKEEYSVVMMFDKDTNLNSLRELANSAAMDKWETVPKTLVTPFKDADKKMTQEGTPVTEKYPNMKGKVLVTAKSQYQPGVVDSNVHPILDRTQFYGGCTAMAEVSAYAWEYQGKKGVGFNLKNIQKVGEGERVGGTYRTASDVFSVVETNEEFDL